MRAFNQADETLKMIPQQMVSSAWKKSYQGKCVKEPFAPLINILMLEKRGVIWLFGLIDRLCMFICVPVDFWHHSRVQMMSSKGLRNTKMHTAKQSKES